MIKVIRVTFTDPDATDSSSDEESGKPRRTGPKKHISEVVIDPVAQTDASKTKESVPKKKIEPQRSKNGENTMVEMRRRKSGRYASEIRDPFIKKRLWLGMGTVDSADEAFEAYANKRSEIDDKKKKGPVKVSGHGKSSSSPAQNASSELPTDSCQGLGEEQGQRQGQANADAGESAGNGNRVEENRGERFGFLNGVLIVDYQGFFLGGLMAIDDLSVRTTEDGAFCRETE